MAKINYILDERSYIVIRDRIATILIDELRNQFAMTYDETLDAQIYVDRSRAVNPQETPLVNITLPEGSYDNQTVIKSDGTFTYEIDCYYSQGYSDGNGGDVASRFNATKLMSACQAILENPIYIKLDFDGPFIMSSHVTNFQVGTIDREDATSIAVATFNLVVKATQSEPVGVGVLIAGSNTIANIEGGPQRLIYEGDATPTPPPVAPGSTVFNTDGKTLGIGPSGGSFIVDDSTYIITDSVGNVLYSGSIPATDEFIQVISNATVTNSLGSTLASIEAQGTVQLADVNNIDSDGSTVPTPAGVPFTCTPPTPSITGLSSPIVVTGDSSDGAIGRDFWEFPIVSAVQQLNHFGSKWRFTGHTGGYYDRDTSQFKDVNGTVTTKSLAFPDGLFIDHFTKDWNGNLVMYYNGDMNSTPLGIPNLTQPYAKANPPASVSTYVGNWNMANINQLLRLQYQGKMQEEPFAPGHGSVLIQSSTDAIGAANLSATYYLASNLWVPSTSVVDKAQAGAGNFFAMYTRITNISEL